jgi:tRNA A-37 threonylcarbamoyl transferase component Bud32
MHMRAHQEDSNGDGSTVDALFDAFMDRALDLARGEELDPTEFLAEFPQLTGAERRELETRLLAISRLAQRPPEPKISTIAFEGDDAIERAIGEYRLIRSLGGGAMGEVYLAEQSSLGRLVALKTQRAELVNSPTAAARFEREARALGSVTHPSVVAVHGFGEADGVRYLAMELVPGRSLKERLEEPRAGEDKPKPVQVTRWGAELARGLEAVHAAGLVHRDVKPSNVRITETDGEAGGHAVLVDFGLARVGESSELSRTGEFVGSPAYASPEQVRGEKELDGRSDVYSLGATLYTALAGRAPFGGENLEAVLHGVLAREPEPLHRQVPGLPRDLCLVVHKALEKEPGRRYASAAKLAEDLEAVLELRGVRAKPLGPLGRVLRRMRRDRLAAGGLAAGLFAVLAAGLFVGESARRESAAIRERARTQLVEAQSVLTEFHVARLELADDEADFERLWSLQEYEHLGPKRSARLAELEGHVKAARERRDRAFVRGENLLASAVRLQPDLEEEANAIGAALLLERLIEATERADKETATLLSVELDLRDPERKIRNAAFPFTRLTLASHVPNTTAWIFRYTPLDDLVAGAEGRQIPLPIRPETHGWSPNLRVPPGAEVLRLAAAPPSESLLVEGDLVTHVAGFEIAGGPLVADVAPATELGEPAVQPGDRLVALDGELLRDAFSLPALLLDQPDRAHTFHFRAPPHATSRQVVLDQAGLDASGVTLESLRERTERLGGRARVIHAGEILEVDLPPGLTLRPSLAAPELLPDGASPLETPLALEPGMYLVVTRAPGRNLTRRFLRALPGAELELDISPRASGLAPSGFVFVANARPTQLGFWIQEREVTSAEYLQFLNQPAVLALVDESLAAGRLLRAPRAASRNAGDLMWPRLPGGPFRLPSDWPARWPILGVSFEDAVAFVAWKNSLGGAGTYALPEAWQTTVAGGAGSDRRYSWGARFDQRFANTCFSRAVARPEPVFANPRDESPHGVYDTTGNALEWVTSFYDETRNLRHATGGSWAQARIDTLSPGGGLGLAASSAGGETGFRLLWRPPASNAASNTDGNPER